MYGGFSWSKDDKSISNRADALLLARLQVPLLKAYANHTDPSADPQCLLCKEEPQAIGNWLWRCFRLYLTRQTIFGSPSLLL